MIATKTTIERESLKNIIQHEEQYNDVFSRNTERITEINSAKKEDKK